MHGSVETHLYKLVTCMHKVTFLNRCERSGVNILNVAHGDDAKQNPLKALSACVKGVYILVYTVGISIVLQAHSFTNS